MKHLFQEHHRDGMQIRPIAIIGIAFRFPGDLHDECDFWQALKEKRNFISQVPSERWATKELLHGKSSEPGRSITFSAGILSRIDEFDAGFFGISPREAVCIDPQQRLLLELTWEVMENGGLRPSAVAGSDCSVYVGISSFDYGSRAADDLASVTSHFMTGNALSIAANRISYVFDLRGPSLAIDTACSSSLVALHHACNSLRTGEASIALAGGVNLLLHPYPFVGFTKASMLSRTGLCRPFDAAGDGYVRSEGGAVLLLKPLDKAIDDGDEIHAVIRASGTNADGGRKTGITIPSRDGQAELMCEVLARSGLSANDIDYVEAHGTGTAVGDPVEAAAIGQVYGQGRARALPIGSVKANIGHLEPVSGLAGLIKAVMVLKNRAIPPALHLQTPNAHIDFQALNLELTTEYKALTKEGDKPLFAGVNSFGFGGANAHVLLQEFCRPQAETPLFPSPPPPLFLSARTDSALRALAHRYADFLSEKSATDFYDIAYAAAFRREWLEKRLVLPLDSPGEASDLLRQYAEGATSTPIIIEDSLSQGDGVAFVYSGNGAQWHGMGRALLAESARFVEIITLLDEAMLPQAGFSVMNELLADEGDSRLDDTVIAQPLLFAIHVAVTMLLREQGIEPLAVTGHSVGEIAAAWAAGALDLGTAIRVVCVRSQAQGVTRGSGRMAAVGMSATEIQTVLAKIDSAQGVEISGINSQNYSSISGSLASLERIHAEVEPGGVFYRLLDLDYAFHSRQMDVIQTTIAEGLAGVSPSPSLKAIFVSTVTGDVLEGTLLDAGYWWRNVREPVRFADAIAKLCNLGCRIFVEIGPNAILQRYIRECLTTANVKGRIIPTLRKNNDGLRQIAEVIFRVHLLAASPPHTLYFQQPGRRVRLPNYPWQRERHWHLRTSEGGMAIDRRRVHPLLGWRLHEAELAWQNSLDPVDLPWLADHKVGGVIVFPGSAYAEMALAAAREWLGDDSLVVEELGIVAPMVFYGEHARTLHLMLNPQDGSLQIRSRQRLSTDDWTLHATGRLLESVTHRPGCRIEALPKSIKYVSRERHYRLASTLGLDYGPTFQGLLEARCAEDRLEVSVEVPEVIQSDGYILHPALLDVCFQSVIDFFSETIEAGNGTALLPVKTGRLNFYGGARVTRSRAHLRRRNARSVLVDFELLDDAENLVASASGCRFQATHLTFSEYQNNIQSWRIIPWLRLHPADSTTSELPSVDELVAQLNAGRAVNLSERQVWFRETLPLIEAMTLSFAYEACQELAQLNPESWQHTLDTSYGRWLTHLLGKENLLEQEDGRWTLAAETELPASKDLWQTLLSDAPTCLPQLTILGRVGSHLPSLLRGEMDTRQFVRELTHVSVIEALFNEDPVYLGTRLVLENVLRHMASELPAARRLRVLEITSGSSGLPKALNDLLSEDRLDYVLAFANEELLGRQQAEYQEHINVIVAALDTADWEILADQPLPDAFDVVILRHVLHRTAHPEAVLAKAYRGLAAGGILLLAERYPDWSANLIEGLEPAWWYKKPEGSELSSLLAPDVWQQALVATGFTECQQFIEAAAEGLSEGAYLLLATKPQAEVLEPMPSPAKASWLLLVDDASGTLALALRSQLESHGQLVEMAERRQQYNLEVVDHVVYLCGWGAVADAETAVIMADLLHDIQRIGSQSEKTVQAWFVTCGGALATDLPAGYTPNIVQSALWGIGRVVMNEYPRLGVTLIDLACDPSLAESSVRLAQELLWPDGTNEILLALGGRYCLVMREEADKDFSAPTQDSRFHLDFHFPGQLGNLKWIADAERSLGDQEIEVRTRAAGLNFRDVMYAMGLLPDEAVESGFAGANLGLEFSGIVTRVGAGVRDVRPGEAVMGFGSACFASHVVTRRDAVVPIPMGWTFEAAATAPTVFFTVYYALGHLADLQPGERVLIHGAAGGIGIAAIQLARHLGAEIFATAGSDEKRDFARLLGADHVFDSRSLSFADDILAVTEGEGVDVVLNSLAGEPMRRSLDVLKPFGRFLELGKRDFFENTPIGLRFFKNNISYFGIDTDQLLNQRPELAARLFTKVLTLFREGDLGPLPYRCFSAARIVDAFRSMQQSRHIGKIVVSLTGTQLEIEKSELKPSKVVFPKKSTWLVTGGLTGFGLESARWLVARGVDTIVLVGRRGMKTPGLSRLFRISLPTA